MFQILKDQSTADRRRIPILFVDATDGYTPETGVTSPTINISKNGGTFAAGAGTFTQIDATNLPGHYYYQFTTGEIDTLGYISFYAIKSGTTRSYNAVIQIMAYDEFSATNLGLSNLDATVSSRSTLTAANVWDYLTSAATVVGSIGKRIADNLDTTVGSRSTLSAANVWDYLTSAATVVGSLGKLLVDNINATISSRLASSSYTTPPTTSAITTAVWTEQTSNYDAGTYNGSFGKNILRADQNSQIGDVTLHQSGGVSRVDADLHAIANDTAAATSFKNILTGVAGETLTADLDGNVTGSVNNVVDASSITLDVWNEVRATSSPTGGIPAAGTYGRFLDAQVSAAGGGGGSATVVQGPFKLKVDNNNVDDFIDLLVGSTNSIQLQSVDNDDRFIPLSASNTNAVKIYNVAGTLVETLTPTINLATNGICTFDITTATTNTAGTYDCILEVTDATSKVVKFGPIKIKVRAL